MEFIEKILNFYLSYADIIDANFYKFAIIFVFLSIFWISLIGIVTPVLLISVLSFGYYGIITSLLSLVLGSIINFYMASKTRGTIDRVSLISKSFKLSFFSLEIGPVKIL